jgi:peptidoglycan/LPS O-acetylase OafA/YrhL
MVGIFSYSLYLTHQLTLLHAFFFDYIKLPPLLFAMLVKTPLAIAFAWIFFRLCERPFISPPRPAAQPDKAEALPEKSVQFSPVSSQQ